MAKYSLTNPHINFYFRDNALSMEELSELLEDLFCTNSHSLSEDMTQKIFSLLDEDKVLTLSKYMQNFI